jgi:hypothetical protein
MVLRSSAFSILELVDFEGGQRTQAHFQDRVGLALDERMKRP